VPEQYAVWLDRDVVEATGPEAGTFLQGQLSQDLLALGDGTSAWSWVLAPTGKVDALVLVTRLNRFKLRTKVELSVLPWKVLGLRVGWSAYWEDVVPVPAWPGLTGIDLLGAAPAVPAGQLVMSSADYEAERIAAGIPKMGAELTEKTIPAETGLNDLTVSFTKGCYTGQELVARIDSRGGNVPRHLRGVVLPERVEPGTELLDAEGRAAGTLTSVGHSSQRGWVGLGNVRRGVAVPGRLQAGPGGPEVEVRELRR